MKEATQQPTQDGIRADLATGRYREAFEGLLGLYAKKIFHLALSMLRNESQAEDMAQEVLVKIWKALPNYHGGASLSTWIYAIARNTCLTELKKRATRPTVSFQDPQFEACLESLPALQSADPHAGMTIDVNEILSQLPEKYRQVITLFYLEQRSYEEVGAMLGLPLGTVKTFLFRGRRELLKLSARHSRKGILELI